MITLMSDREAAYSLAPGRVQEMYVDTDAFYKMFYVFYKLGLADYFTTEVDQNGTGVYIRIITKEDIENV